MALPTSPSLVCSLALCVLTFAAMQMFSEQLANSQLGTIGGGFVGSLLFCFMLTAVGNAETLMFEKGFQTKLFPEVIGCILLAMGVSAAVHRVCATTCLIFSLVDLYYINRISQATYGNTTTTTSSKLNIPQEKNLNNDNSFTMTIIHKLGKLL